MESDYEDASAPYASWEHDCLRAARDRHGRRLGKESGQQKRLGSAIRNEHAILHNELPGDDYVILQTDAPPNPRFLKRSR